MDPKIDDASSAMRVTKLLYILHILPQVAHGVLEDVYMIIFKNEHADKTYDVNVRNGHHKVKSSSVSQYLQNCFSKLKASFSNAVSSLDMFEDHLIAPSEKTANPLKQMFHCKKEDSGEHLRTHEFNEMLDHLKAVSDYFIPHSEKESKKSLHFDCRIFEVQIPESENFEYALKICSSFITPSSISEEAKRLDLENSEISSFSSLNFEPDEKPLQNYSKEKQKQEKQQYVKNVNLMIAQEPKNIEESLIFSEKKPLRKKSINRTVYKRKSKKVEMKVPAEDLSSLDEEIHTIKLSDYEVEENMKALKNELHLLRVEKQELMADLGQLIFEKTAMEREARKLKFFQRIYRPSSPEAKHYVVSTSSDKARTEDDTLGYPNDNYTTLRESSYANENASSSNRFATDFSKTEAINENVDLTSLVSTAVSSKQAVQGAGSLVKETDHRPEKEEHVKSDKAISTDNNENKNPTTQKLPSVTSKKTASGGEAVDKSENATGASNASSISRGENIEQSLTLQSYDGLSFSVQQDYSNEKEKISLSNVPPTSVATTLYNNYKLLLLSLGQMLLSNDVTKLMAWATQNFPIVNPQNATHVLFQLDENEVINASDLSQLRHFFESIVRFDLVYVIDAFLLGDYGILRQITTSKKRDVNTQQTSQTGTTTRYQNLFNAASNSQFPLRNSSLRGENSNEPQTSVLQQKQQAFPTLVLNQPTPNDAKFVPRSPNENYSTAYGLQSLKSGAMGFTASQVVVDGHVTNERRTTTGNSSTNANSSGTGHPRNTQTIGSNGSRLSTLRRNQEQSDNWLCSHYKRHCYVKFECCDQFWPCHRCHNNQSTCGRKKLKSRDTQMVKCVYCNKVQQFGEHCCDCGAKFANYYCGKCKHLTGTDDHPYHCEKCGICRIHGDRSFHCDICGVCLDVQLRGNHKCREGSAHDECCICLEDAFTGCQILPCSHKVHKECATQMIRSGITRCPICRESFAHKLERRPLPNSRKRGK